MSLLVSMMDFDTKDRESVDKWAFSNGDDHANIHQSIQSQSLGNLFVYQLYPINLTRWDSFAQQHQNAHNEVNEALALAGTDLTGVDFNDPAKAAEWSMAHYTEHRAWHAKLGI